MSDHQLTSGAERIFSHLESRLPADSLTGSQLYRLLLESLWTLDSKASEILNESDAQINQLGQWEDSEQASEEFSYPQWKQNLIRRADQLAIQHSLEQFTGTEHLLLAAMELNSFVAKLLNDAGLTNEKLEALLTETIDPLEVPAETEIRLKPANAGTLDETGLARILDAAANRCREGLRVVEDYVRFHLSDAALSRELKETRHQLTAILIHLGQQHWITCRDSIQDVGPRAELASEKERGSLSDVLRANMKRVEEAFRSLEEYSKRIDAELSHRISRCRYRFYTIEKGIELAIRAESRLADCHVYLLVTQANCRYAVETTIRETISAGVDAVQIREKDLDDRELIDYAKKVRKWTEETGTLLFINDRPDIAALTGADGVHLGQTDMSVSEARRILGTSGLIGVSTHHLEQARQAVLDGADYLGAGPVFTSQTKQFSEFAGLEYIQELAGKVSVPWFAIGGITLDNLQKVQNAGANRVAIGHLICGAPHPRGVSQQLSARLRKQTYSPS